MKVKLSDGLVLRVEFKEIRPKKGTSLLHKATHLTVAELSWPGGKAIGRAFTSRKDKHDPYEGRKTALQRAIAASPASSTEHENDRLRLWVAFAFRELEQIRQKDRDVKRPGGTLPSPAFYVVEKGITAPRHAPSRRA